MTTRWTMGVDVGGTFTDAVAVAADGRLATAKVVSTPDDLARGLLDALGALAARSRARSLGSSCARPTASRTCSRSAPASGRTCMTSSSRGRPIWSRMATASRFGNGSPPMARQRDH